MEHPSYGCVKFQIKSRTKYQIKCLKMIFRMTQEYLSKKKSELIINKIFLFILFEFKNLKKFKSISIEWPL